MYHIQVFAKFGIAYLLFKGEHTKSKTKSMECTGTDVNRERITDNVLGV